MTEAEGERIRAHVFVSGRVQGVSYRANTRDTAREVGVDRETEEEEVRA